MSLNPFPSRQLDLGSVQYFEVLPEEIPGNQVLVRAGWLKNEKVMVSKPQQTTVAFSPTAAINQVRWDLVYLDLLGNVTVLPGVNQPSSAPEFTGAPNPLPYTLPLAHILITEAGSVTVTQDDITSIIPRENFLFDSVYSQHYPNYRLTNGMKPDLALAHLDNECSKHEDFSGKSRQGIGTFLPKYSDLAGVGYLFSDGVPLESACSQADAEANRIKNFLGKTNLAETLPDYSAQTGHNVISINDKIKVAVGKLDNVWNAGGLLPVGFVLPFAGAAPPSGFLECNGTDVSRITYSVLFSVIGVLYGPGDGINTFTLPELRGEFIRGWDNARGEDSGRTLASWQDDQFKSHTHRIRASGNPGTDGILLTTVTDTELTGGKIENTGGAETRPRNLAMIYCIRY